MVNIQGVRPNQLIGYGLVVGLEGTGDQTPFTNQSVTNVLQQMGVNMPQGGNPKAKNVAAVVVTGSLGAYSQPGQVFGVTVSSMGSAKSLRGGTLMMTPLKGADGNVYAMAQGGVVVSSPGAFGGDMKPNSIATGNIASGATVERAVSPPVGAGNYIMLELRSNDFSLAGRVVAAINNYFGAATAEAQNGLVIQVRAPMKYNDRVVFIGALEALEVIPAMVAPKVVINARTGSIVINQAVRIDACAVSHNGISLIVSDSPSAGNVLAPPYQKLAILKPGALLTDVVTTLDSIGVLPADMVVILQSMKVAGALHAEIEII